MLRAALDIVDREGVDSLSMRRLGRALDRDPMARLPLRRDQDGTPRRVVELVLERPHCRPHRRRLGQSQLREFARRFRAIAVAHPHVVPLLVTRPLATPLALRPHGTLRPLESTLDLLVRNGFSDVDALHVYRLFFGLLFGHVLNELQELVDNPEETDDLLRLGLHRLPIKEFPLLRGLAPALATTTARRSSSRVSTS